MHFFRTLCFVTLLLFCFVMTAVAAQSQEQNRPADASALQPSRGTSGIPSNTPRALGVPSGQGTMPQGFGAVPTQLYVPGKHLSGGRPFTAVPAYAQQLYTSPDDSYPPFGANLFQGYFAGTYYEGMNTEYVITPGDRILVHLWGAHAYSDTLMVDQQGNIFLPEVGPVPVAGLRHGQLQSTIRNYLASTFKTNMELYVNLLTAQPVAVYVTGFVQRPGRYAGGMSDSVLYYLDRAGGIIPDRGTYRDIVVQRNNRTVAHVDLYSFILTGKIPGGALRDGDVIVVGPRGSNVIVGGRIPQQATYEGKNNTLSGDEISQLASPQPMASHVSVTGTREAAPFNIYLSLKEFGTFSLAPGDTVEFLADKPGSTIMISVTGSTLGATRYPVKRDTSLHLLLAHVPIDSTLANISGVYLKRKSVVEQQRKALADSMHRLENAVLTASSATVEEANIRVQEAQLVQNFVQRVSKLEPDGVVVVTRKGVTSDIILEDGDEIVIPQKSDVVQISGEVMIPKAVVYEKGMPMKNYVQNAGGFTDRADKKNILVVHPNGEIVQGTAGSVEPGDMILVMPRYDTKGFQIFKDLMQVLYQVAVATKVIVSL